jgi:hypothetical protein
MTLKLVTFKTNQTVLGDVENVMYQSADCITIKKPVQVATQVTKDGPMLGFIPYLEYAHEFETGITIYRSDILTINSPVRELENQYNTMFGSGIQIASTIPKY